MLAGRDRMLEVLGVPEVEERVYVTLLGHPGLSLQGIVELTGLTRTKVRNAVELLETHGLITRSPGDKPTFSPRPPEAVLDGLMFNRQRELERARAEASNVLAKLYHRDRAKALQLVEFVSGEDAVFERSIQLFLSAEQEFLCFSRPPYTGTFDESHERLKLAEGIAFRFVYDHSALEHPGILDWIRRDVAAGEQARVVPELPMKLFIVDQRAAVMIVEAGRAAVDQVTPTVEEALFVRESSVLDALIEHFELTWDRAVPFTATDSQRVGVDDDGEHLSPEDQELIALMAAGVKDQVIALQLGTTARSLRRRTGPLLDRLGARTRFQAGVQAARRGWISDT